VSIDKGSVDDDVARIEKYLRLYFNSLAKSGTIRTFEEEFNFAWNCITGSGFQTAKIHDQQ